MKPTINRSIAACAATLLLVVCVYKVLALALHTPVIGYANQYDAARTSACIDFWPDTAMPEAGNPAAPVRQYLSRWSAAAVPPRSHRRSQCLNVPAPTASVRARR